MDPDVLKRFELMERAHQRAMERMDRADARSARIEAKHDRDFKKAMERMDRLEARHEQAFKKHDRQLEVTGKLLRAGIVLVRELQKSQKAFLDSLRGGNGHRNLNGRKGKRDSNGKKNGNGGGSVHHS